MPGLSHTTMPLDDFKKIVKNLPKRNLDFWLSGGEIFTIKNLYDYLETVKNENILRKKKNQGGIELVLETNEKKKKNDEKRDSILSDLSNFDLDGIFITSYDKFHEEQGTDLKKLRQLKKIIEDKEIFSFVKLYGADEKILRPIGRAENLIEYNTYTRYPCLSFLDRYYMVIDPKGDLYHCYCGYFKIPGNAIHEPIVEIIRRARKDKRLTALNSGSVRKLAKLDGYKKEDIEKAIDIFGRCGFCIELYAKKRTMEEIFEKAERLREEGKI